MTAEVTDNKTRKPAPLWTLAATLFGTASLTGWLTSIPGGNHDSLSHPNATSMGIEEDELLYIVQPWPDAVDAVLGIAGFVVLAAVLVRLTRMVRAKTLETDSVVIAGLLALTGVLLGLIWMSVTYGTVDANIGGGLAVLLGLPLAGLFFIPALVIYATPRSKSDNGV